MRENISLKIEDASEFEMLDDWELSNNLGLEHLHQALCDLLPIGHGTYIVEDGGALAEGNTFFHLLDKGNAPKVHEVI